MTVINFTIHRDIIETLPEVEVAALRASIPDPNQLAPIVEELATAVAATQAELETIDPITTLPQIAVWREAYSHMKIKPSKFHSSIEALLRRVKKGDDLDTGLHIVDFYNLISVAHRAPIGAYDATKFGVAGITLRKSDPEKDQFNPLGGRPEAFPLNPDLVVYGSGDEIVCWGFNTRDSRTVCVEENTSEILFFSEVPSRAIPRPQMALEAIAELLTAASITVGEIEVFNSERLSGAV